MYFCQSSLIREFEPAYTRDTLARITLVQSRKIATDPWANIATGIVYQPMSRLVQSLFAGNGLSNWNTPDHFSSQVATRSGAAACDSLEVPLWEKSPLRGGLYSSDDELDLKALSAKRKEKAPDFIMDVVLARVQAIAD
jgi:hypothetical protein